MGQEWREVQLGVSYRSTKAILHIVDEVFATDRRGVSFDGAPIVHQAFRDHHPGMVTLWPLIQSEKEEEPEAWQLPLIRLDRVSARTRLAQHIAIQIEEWLASGSVLPSTNQPIQPRDILILVRKRTALVGEIIRSLKKKGIPVAGADRLVLMNHIAVMDLLALGQFVLLPEDDLTLACLLRSPLIGMSEDDLFDLAHQREGSLWDSLRKSENFRPAQTWLKACLKKADLSPIYEFYNWVLIQGEGRRRFLSRLGQEVEEILDEFLNQALRYESDHASSLQGFVQFMKSYPQEIKREASDTIHNQVRLMTVHGAKGLQAPVVILPDAAESGKSKIDTLLWGDHLVMVRPTQPQDTEGTSYLKERANQNVIEEQRRLLYVALTRAQDRLYVGGWMMGKEIPEDGWYRSIQKALEAKAGGYVYAQGILQETLQEPLLAETSVSLPAWATESPKEDHKRKEQSKTTQAMDRGTLIHRFFEVLPDLASHDRYQRAYQMISKEGLDLRDWESDIKTVIAILEDPLYQDFFGSTSFAEVPVVGVIEGIPFQGRIDRLVVTPDRVTIVDYKTDRNIPEDIPQNYRQQLEEYAAVLRPLYPHHEIHKVLIWTGGPKVQRIA
jgi:ATP-dependent helicase/nuclease subunit A